MSTILSFLFYFIFLIGAELPLFGILLIRETSNNNVNNVTIIVVLLLLSILINIYFFISLTKNIKSNIENEKNRHLLSSVTENKVTDNLNSFFAIFLLPFFTFSFTSNISKGYLLTELVFIFILLSLFLYKSKNVTTNLLIYLVFNIYEADIPGKNVVIITDTNRNQLNNERLIINRVLTNVFVHVSDFKKILRQLTTIIIFLIILFFIILFLFKSNLIEVIEVLQIDE